LKNIFEKFGVQERREAVAMAQSMGLLQSLRASPTQDQS